jgi:hypothetical protein
MRNLKIYSSFILVLFIIVFVSCGKETKVNKKESRKITEPDAAVSLYTEINDVGLLYSVEKIGEEKVTVDKNYMLQSSLSDILANTTWYNTGSGREMLKFYPDLTWTLTDFFGLGEFVRGSYTVRDDFTVSLELSNREYRDYILADSNSAETVVKYVFGNEPNLSFVLQRDYVDFYAVGRLYNEQFDKTFISAVPSPENENYELDGITVAKKNGQIMIEGIIPTKKEPFDDAEEFSVLFVNRFGSFAEYLIDRSAKVNVALPGEVFYYDAIYNAEDNKLWYRIKVYNSMTYEDAWICGEFAIENSVSSKNYSDYRKIQSALIELGYINAALIER